MKKEIGIIILSLILVSVTFSSIGKENKNNFEKITDQAIYDKLYVTMTQIPPEPDMSSRTTKVEEDCMVCGDSDLPSAFNWIDYQGGDWTTPVRDQGPCGSCWAFSAVAMIEAKLNIAHDDPDMDIDLSEQYVLSCLPASGGCNGGWAYSALDCIFSTDLHGNYVNGIVSEECMPYQADDDIPCSSKCENWENELFCLENFGVYNFPDNTEGKNALKQLLIEEGPLGVHFYVTYNFKEWGDTHHSPDDYYPYEPAVSTNHAVLLVGYKDDPSIPHGGYWIIKNSWGSSFGYGGFFNIEYGSLRIDWDALWVDVTTNFILDFDYSPKSITNQDIVTFDATSNQDISSWWWDFDDGYYSDLEEPVHRFFENGIYTVKLTVTNSQGIKCWISKDIEVPTGLIVVDFDYNPISPSTQNTIQFTDESKGSTIDTWQWDFGDGSGSAIQNPTHRYNDDGTYFVTLTITGDSNTISITKDIYVSNEKPVCDFSYILNDDQVSFFDDSYDLDGTIVSYDWDFGDGSNSNEKDPVHTYTNRGTFTITHKAVDDDGDDDTNSYQITIDIGPIAGFSYTPLNPTIEDTIQFIDESIDALTWFWDFDDGSTSYNQNPTHQFTNPGTYDVSLEVVDYRNIADTFIKEIIVEPPNVPPEASFNYIPNVVGVSDEISFVDTSVDSDGTIISWFWDFGDGSTTDIKNPQKTYFTVGGYSVSLTVTDDDGDFDTMTKIINVLPNNPPSASFIYTPLNPTTASDIHFSDNSVDTDGTIVSWYWDFGDNNYSNLQNPQHKYSISGTYDAKLEVTDNDGDSNSYIESIFVDISYEYLDIEQTEWCYPSFKLYKPYEGAQSFVPHVSTITRIQVYLSKYDKNNILSGNVILSIKNDLNGNTLASKTVSINNIQTTWQWIEFDIADLNVNPGETYYIIVKSTSKSDNEYLLWAKGKYTGYYEGSYYETDNYWWTWKNHYSYDFCFKIYGI